MSGPRAKVVALLRPQLPDLMPDRGRAKTAGQLRTALGPDVPYADTTIRLALDVLERDGEVASFLAPGRGNSPTRFFYRAGAAP